MRHVIAYDISDDRRRERIAKVLEGFGQRVQLSVFEVECETRDLTALVASLERLIHENSDGIRIYRLCANCHAATHTIGATPTVHEPLAWIV